MAASRPECVGLEIRKLLTHLKINTTNVIFESTIRVHLFSFESITTNFISRKERTRRKKKNCPPLNPIQKQSYHSAIFELDV